MKISFFLLVSIICQNVLCQLKLTCQTEKQVCLEYTNTTYDTAYFTNPLFYTQQERKKNKIIIYLRSDMYDIDKDTLQLYFTDSTLSKYNHIYHHPDKKEKKPWPNLVVVLPPKSKVQYTICFRRKFKYNFVEVKYNFGYRKNDFFNAENNYPVSVIRDKKN